MSKNLQQLDSVVGKIQAILDKCMNLEDERDSLVEEKIRLLSEIKNYKLSIGQLQEEVKVLKAAKGSVINGSSKGAATGQIDDLIKEIDRCISKLGD